MNNWDNQLDSLAARAKANRKPLSSTKRQHFNKLVDTIRKMQEVSELLTNRLQEMEVLSVDDRWQLTILTCLIEELSKASQEITEKRGW